MNFMKSPPPKLKPNVIMDEEQLAVAAAFVDELLALKVLHLLDNGEAEIILNAPLFLVPKEGQPGKWQVFADMLRGCQNMYIGNDPTVLPCISHILALMYEGGYLVVVDASKFFYQFKTHPDDQKYLGLIHLVTGIPDADGGLPMGAGQSPSLACRYGLAFLRTLQSCYAEFQGLPLAKCWWNGFSETGFDPKLGYGFILESDDGPAVGTHSTYQTKLRIICNFEQRYGVDVLRSTPLDCPPSGPDIPLTWCQEAYGLRKSPSKRHTGSDLNLAFSTIRQLCSAASQFHTWDMMIS
jgi:hypothetical protein